MSGRGKLFYQSGKIAYDGEWSNDQFTGFGVLYNEEPVMLNKAFEYTNLDEIDEYWTRFEGIRCCYGRRLLRRFETWDG